VLDGIKGLFFYLYYRHKPNIAYCEKLTSSGSGLVDKVIARLNIEHYRKQLADETDEAGRNTIMRLLAEEEAKLTALDDPPGKKRKK
jgi:hypothetical protein